MFGGSFAACGPLAVAAGGLAPGSAIPAGPAVRVAGGLLSCAGIGAANSPAGATRRPTPAATVRWLGWKGSAPPSGRWIAGEAGTATGRTCGAAGGCMASPLGSSGRGMSTAGTAASAGVAMICDPASSDGASPTCGTLPTAAAGSAASSTASGRAAGASTGLAGGIAGKAEPAAHAARGPAGNSGG
jgi:hypothetical protein